MKLLSFAVRRRCMQQQSKMKKAKRLMIVEMKIAKRVYLDR